MICSNISSQHQPNATVLHAIALGGSHGNNGRWRQQGSTKKTMEKNQKKNNGWVGKWGGAGVNQVKIRCHKTLTAERGELILTDRVCESKCP